MRGPPTASHQSSLLQRLPGAGIPPIRNVDACRLAMRLEGDVDMLFHALCRLLEGAPATKPNEEAQGTLSAKDLP